MANLITIKKGLDIPLQGNAKDETTEDSRTEVFAIAPDDYPGYTWKVAVKPGDTVKCGSPLLCAKECGDITLTSPVSGIVSDIHRGERRKIEFVSVIREGEQTQAEIESDGTLLSGLRKSGLFALMRQRPYDIVPDCNTAPRDILSLIHISEPTRPY